MMAAAIIQFQGVVYSPLNEASPLLRSQLLCEESSIFAKRYSPQALIMAKMAVVIYPGFANGMIILQIVPSLEHPSMVAASSKSVGIESKYPFNIQMQIGNAKVV